MRRIPAFLLCTFLLTSSAAGQAISSQRVDSLFRLFTKTTPGAAVAIVLDSEVIYQRGYGMADLEHGIPVTPRTVFDIASVSKQFAGFAVASLVEDGLIDLDAEARDYLPELPDFGYPLTVRHLVHHISGIRDWPSTLAAGGWRMDDVISFDQILRMAWNQRELNFVPGSEYSYSNTGYNLLAEIVSRVTGQTYASWVDENILALLAMEESRVQDDHTEMIENRAFGYEYAGGAYHTVMNGLTAVGSSSQFSSAEDMAQWLANYDRTDIGGRAVIDRMHTQGILNDGERIAYAYGISSGEYRGLETWSHTGSWAGFRSVVLHFPERRFGVVILSNLASFDPSSRAYRIVDIFLGPPADSSPSEDVGPNPSPLSLDTTLLREYAGTYRLDAGWYVTITAESGGLYIQATNESRFPMTPVSTTEFRVEAYGASVHFERDDNGAVSSIRYRSFTAPRVEPFDPSTIDISDYEGVYESDELHTRYTVHVENGKLFIDHFRHGRTALTQTFRDEFSTSQWFLTPVTFMRDDTGDVVGMLVGRGRSRNLRFLHSSD